MKKGYNATMGKIKGEVLLLITAFIWGTAFVFQSISANIIGPFLFNGIRFVMGGLVLSPFLFKVDRYRKDVTLFAGVLLGIIMFIAPNLQQFALQEASAGKAGFITSLYIVLVPIINFILFKKKISKNVLIALIIAVVGLYLLCGASLDLEISDTSLILCAFFFALQIIVVEQYIGRVNPIKLSCLQYLFGGIFSLIASFIFEVNTLQAVIDAGPSLLYTGLFSTAIAYTFQIIGQSSVESTVASMIMSLESVIAAIAGFFALGQKLSIYELIGCILMFMAVTLAERPNKKEN